jgi:hypothetical protein
MFPRPEVMKRVKEGATMSNKGHIGCGRGLCKSGKKE